MTEVRALPDPGVIVLNGPFRLTRPLLRRLSEAHILATDGAANRLLRRGIRPVAAIGDFDSSPPPENLRTLAFPPEKDATDGELALREALLQGWSPLLVVGAFGGRYDMALSHIALLRRAREAGVDASLTDGRTEALLVRHRTEPAGSAGDTVSVIPLTPEARLVSSGLKWPLDGLSLGWSAARGVSNRVVQDGAWVRILQGQALLVRPLA